MVNKIAFIYEYGTETWSTPSSIMTEFTSRGWETRRYHLTAMTKQDELDLLEFNPEISIVMDWKGIDLSIQVKNQLANTGTYLIRENADTPQNYDRHLPCCDGYHLLLTPDYVSCEKYKQAGYNCIWWTHFADTRIHNTYKGLDDLPPVRSTRGSGGSQFLDVLSAIMPDKFINKNGMIGVDYGAFLNNGKITVQNSRWQEITRRIFEGMACNTLVITDRLPKETRIGELFVDGDDIVYYDDMPSCISLINYYLNTPEERNRIARNGREKVLQYHTQIQRVDQILNEFNQWKESSQS